MNNHVVRLIAFGALLVLMAVTLYLFRPVENTLTRISVVGDSQGEVQPDMAVITFSVVTHGKQAVDAQQENARKSEAVRQVVESVTAGANAEIKTSGYNLRPEQDYYSGKMPKILGYEVRNTVTVSMNDLQKVGALIDAVTRAGANSVQGIQFTVGESSPAKGDALALATTQAMSKAESIAKSLNGRIVRVIETTEGGLPISSPLLYQNSIANSNSATRLDATKSYIPTPLQPGTLNVRSSVILVVDIQM